MPTVDYMNCFPTGPGTIAGQYMRKFWHPVQRAEDIKQVGQGPYELRKKENLGRSDTPLILQRKLWIRELQALTDGAPLTQWTRSERICRLFSYSHVPDSAHAKV